MKQIIVQLLCMKCNVELEEQKIKVLFTLVLMWTNDVSKQVRKTHIYIYN